MIIINYKSFAKCVRYGYYLYQAINVNVITFSIHCITDLVSYIIIVIVTIVIVIDS